MACRMHSQAFPHVSWMRVEPPVRAGLVVLKFEHGDVGLGTTVQGRQSLFGADPVFLQEQGEEATSHRTD